MRSRYVWVVLSFPGRQVMMAFTVKKELSAWLENGGWGCWIEIVRVDCHKRETVALDRTTLELRR